MGRFDDYDDCWEGPPPEFWQQALMNHLQGRKGQAMLREIEAALLALPKPRLIEGALVRAGEVCAVGAVVVYRRRQRGESVRSILKRLRARTDPDENDRRNTEQAGVDVGLTRTMAWWLGEHNDRDSRPWAFGYDRPPAETPEARHARILAMVRGAMHQAVMP